MSEFILTLNAGSSSLKSALYHVSGGEPEVRAQVERIGSDPVLTAKQAGGARIEQGVDAEGQAGALHAMLDVMRGATPDVHIACVAHRLVHGGPGRDESVVVAPALLEELAGYAPYAPLHQPHNIFGVRTAMEVFPDALQVACFDTAFHRHHPWVNDTFALPRDLYDKGVRRYGFHGLSYDYIASRLAADYPELHGGRVAVAHLGSGASMCGLSEGRSVTATMGFSALDGLPMGTRCGQLDPGVVLYLLDEEAMTSAEIADLLYKRSGLLGLSGISNDMRVLQASDAAEAAEAVAYFTYRVRRELGGIAATLGGLDGVVFTGGIGENSASVRAEVCDTLDWLGIAIDPGANEAGGPVISDAASRVTVLCLATDEEAVLAREARRHLS